MFLQFLPRMLHVCLFICHIFFLAGSRLRRDPTFSLQSQQVCGLTPLHPCPRRIDVATLPLPVTAPTTSHCICMGGGGGNHEIFLILGVDEGF